MKQATKVILAVVISIALLSTFTNAILASSDPPPPPNPIGTCPAQTGDKGFLSPPPPSPKGTPKPVMVLNIWWTIQNDEDSGLSGYWALDHDTTTLQVWQMPDGSFYALKKYTGVFSAPQTVIGPGTAAAALSQSAFGTIQGGYMATFSGTFTPGSQPTSGYIGTKNYGGTITDVLTAANHGDSTPYDWIAAYFGGPSSTAENTFAQPHWGWAYLLDHNFVSSTSMNQWCNYNTTDGGNSGDILA